MDVKKHIWHQNLNPAKIFIEVFVALKSMPDGKRQINIEQEIYIPTSL